MSKGQDNYSLFCDIACDVGEGPTYDPGTDTIYWFDIHGRKLIEKPRDSSAIVHDLPFAASVLAFIDAGRQLIASEDGLYERRADDGSLTRLAGLESDNKETRSNDGRVHPSGALWIGTMGWNAQEQAGAIYHFHCGELRVLYDNITVPNAICFTADGATGYFTDTPTGRVMRVALDPANGLPVSEPAVYLAKDATERGWPDGAVVDADGNVWVARWEGSCVLGFDPTGRLIDTIELPTELITCPAFIGPDLSHMIVTSAYTNLSDEQRRQQPMAGKTFLVEQRFNGKADPRVVV